MGEELVTTEYEYFGEWLKETEKHNERMNALLDAIEKEDWKI